MALSGLDRERGDALPVPSGELRQLAADERSRLIDVGAGVD